MYALVLALDANFRLKLKDCGVVNDPELGPGWSYTVEDGPYREEVEKHVETIEVRQLSFIVIYIY